ncbi:DUF2884 family protein [Glaciecola sp. XM2]|jgi:hypothetical protein|uniref:DUF2884 family protein n=1 Tax=Glaciecola sp. XM2 TaxID=1914931 RepID=UPI001BDEC954|nr:DUF2884 family protein [Glaciecola sp. XM2]MBT1451125.1 DUF2884 family protein [Glaciecola sp. XM2]
MKMHKTILVAVGFISMFSHNAVGHNLQNDACEVRLQGDLVLVDGQVTLSDENDAVIVLNRSGEATVNGRTLVLNTNEQARVTSYVEGIEYAVPRAIELAANAIELTNFALTEVFTGLLGQDSRLVKLLNEKLTALKQKLDAHIYQTPNAITFKGDVFGLNETGKSELEKEIDAAVEDLLATAMAEMFIALGKGMLSGNGGLQELESKMNNLGDQLEATIETESQKLADDAQALCDSIELLDIQESQLNNIDGLQDLDFFEYQAVNRLKA